MIYVYERPFNMMISVWGASFIIDLSLQIPPPPPTIQHAGIW